MEPASPAARLDVTPTPASPRRQIPTAVQTPPLLGDSWGGGTATANEEEGTRASETPNEKMTLLGSAEYERETTSESSRMLAL